MTSAEDFARSFFAEALGVDLAEKPRGYDSFTEFKKLLIPDYINAPHLQMLDEHLEQVCLYVETLGAEGIGRLMVEMPPRHGKSLTCSQLFPIWCLGRNPEWRLMLTSYGVDLARKNSRAARNLIREPEYKDLFGLELARDSQSVTEWNLEGYAGGCDALGVQGGAAGKGAHVLIPDDVIKNRAQAESEVYRDSVFGALTSDLFTRLAPGGAVVMPNTRWHEDDPAGRLLNYDKEFGDWVRLRLPGLAEEEDQLGRAVGEALWEARYSRDTLLKIRDGGGMTPYEWSGLYQQRPSPAAGGVLKREWFLPAVRVLPPIVREVRFWDLAMSSKTSADYTVGLKLGLGADGDFYITDIARGQVELYALPKFIKDVMLADGARVTQGFEKAGMMTRAIQTIARDRDLSPWTIKSWGVHADKFTRALPAAARASVGVIHLYYADWNETFLQEIVSFRPKGSEHDDQVDAFSGAWDLLNHVERQGIKTEVKRWA